jgi:hypothetical protein
VLFVLSPPGKTATLLGEFSVVRWGFHAGTTPWTDGPFRNKLNEAGGTFSRGRVPDTKFCDAAAELFAINNARVPKYWGLPARRASHLARTMRLLMAAFAFALLTASAHAQVGASQAGGAHGRHGRQQPEKGGPQKPKTDDKAYNAALRNIPDKKYDAWHGVR